MENEEVKNLITELNSILVTLKTSLQTEEMPFDFSYTPDPGRAVLFRESCLYRITDILDAAYDAFVKDNLLAAFILVRAFMETEALFWAFIDNLEEFLKTRSIDKIREFLSESMVGVRSDELKKFKSPKNPNLIMSPKNILTYIDKMDEKITFYRIHYDSLSEHSHPNAAGTVDAYITLDHEARVARFGRNKGKLNPELVLPQLVGSLKGFIMAYDYSASLLKQFVPLCEELLDIKNDRPKGTKP